MAFKIEVQTKCLNGLPLKDLLKVMLGRDKLVIRAIEYDSLVTRRNQVQTYNLTVCERDE